MSGTVVFGARRLGRGIASHLTESGRQVLAVARSESTIESLAEEQPDVIGRAADLGEPAAAVTPVHHVVDASVSALRAQGQGASSRSREASRCGHSPARRRWRRPDTAC